MFKLETSSRLFWFKGWTGVGVLHKDNLTCCELISYVRPQSVWFFRQRQECQTLRPGIMVAVHLLPPYNLHLWSADQIESVICKPEQGAYCL